MADPLPSGIALTAPPPPGTLEPGQLYADANNRTAWLGVDDSVDPAEAILISDIIETLNYIDASKVEANDYTNAQVATKAPLVHTHTAAQITDFEAAVEAITGGGGGGGGTNIPVGGIIMWSGALTAIGVGALAGWGLCDGTNGTPNLKNRFVMGAGDVNTGVLNPNSVATSNSSGNHTHTIGGTALTTANLPSHTHPVSLTTGNESNSHTHPVDIDGSTNTTGSHTHTVTAARNTGGANQAPSGTGNFDSSANIGSSSAGSHSHTVNVSGNTGARSTTHTHSVSGNTGAAGSGTTHTHTIDTTGAHTHTINGTALRDAIPYYAIAFIMRLV
jgi:hypothetical protein